MGLQCAIGKHDVSEHAAQLGRGLSLKHHVLYTYGPDEPTELMEIDCMKRLYRPNGLCPAEVWVVQTYIKCKKARKRLAQDNYAKACCCADERPLIIQSRRCVEVGSVDTGDATAHVWLGSFEPKSLSIPSESH